MLNIILIGPQGSGKGAQAQLITKEFGLKYIEMGSIIREYTQNNDKKSQILDNLVNKKGILLPDGIVLDMIYLTLEEQPSNKGYLFDGFPRTVKQYQALKEYLANKGLKINLGLYLRISDEEGIRRLGTRRLCSVCKKGYSLRLEPERKNCDCGGELIKRPDDEPEAILPRLAAFHKLTESILEMMKNDGILREINGERSIEDIYRDVRQMIKSPDD
jgi:adenylate kinase